MQTRNTPPFTTESTINTRQVLSMQQQAHKYRITSSPPTSSRQNKSKLNERAFNAARWWMDDTSCNVHFPEAAAKRMARKAIRMQPRSLHRHLSAANPGNEPRTRHSHAAADNGRSLCISIYEPSSNQQGMNYGTHWAVVQHANHYTIQLLHESTSLRIVN